MPDDVAIHDVPINLHADASAAVADVLAAVGIPVVRAIFPVSSVASILAVAGIRALAGVLFVVSLLLFRCFQRFSALLLLA